MQRYLHWQNKMQAKGDLFSGKSVKRSKLTTRTHQKKLSGATLRSDFRAPPNSIIWWFSQRQHGSRKKYRRTEKLNPMSNVIVTSWIYCKPHFWHSLKRNYCVPFNFQYHTASCPYFTYSRSWQNFFIYQYNSWWVIISFILMTSLTENALLLQREIWRWLPLDVKG